MTVSVSKTGRMPVGQTRESQLEPLMFIVSDPAPPSSAAIRRSGGICVQQTRRSPPAARDHAANARDPWTLDVRGDYGMRMPGGRLLTWSAR